MKIYCYISGVLILFLFSCGLSTNPDPLGDQGQKVCEQFYSYLEEGNLKSSAKMCGGNLSYTDGLNVLLKIESLLGKLDSTQYVDGIYKTTYHKGLAKSQWELYFKGFYGDRVTNESFVLVELGDSIKIDGYYIKEIVSN